MDKIAWITDSTSGIEAEVAKKYNIHVVPLHIIFKDKSYKDGIDLSEKEFYEKLKREKELPKTSQPAIGEFVEFYERLKKEYDRGIVIHVADELSGTLRTSRMAAEMAEFPVEIIDSRLVVYPMVYLLLDGIEMHQNGKSYEEIVTELKRLTGNMRAYFMVNDLSQLQRGGRMSSAQALLGSLLQIKPILRLNNGKVELYEKVRTYTKAKKRIFEIFAEDVKDAKEVRVCIPQGNAREEALKWKEELEQMFPHLDFHISQLGAVVGTHVGEGTLAIAWYCK
jgi:DegV family protein with EDD domain